MSQGPTEHVTTAPATHDDVRVRRDVMITGAVLAAVVVGNVALTALGSR